MNLGFVSAILPDLSFEEVIQFAAETGFSCVEIMCWPKGKAERRYAGVTHIDVTGFKQADADRVRAILREAHVDISALGYYPNYLTPDKEEALVCHRGPGAGQDLYHPREAGRPAGQPPRPLPPRYP